MLWTKGELSRKCGCYIIVINTILILEQKEPTNVDKDEDSDDDFKEMSAMQDLLSPTKMQFDLSHDN